MAARRKSAKALKTEEAAAVAAVAVAPVGAAEFAADLEVSTRQVQLWAKDGMPHTRQGRRLLFDRAACLAWLRDHRRDGSDHGGKRARAGRKKKRAAAGSRNKNRNKTAQVSNTVAAAARPGGGAGTGEVARPAGEVARPGVEVARGAEDGAGDGASGDPSRITRAEADRLDRLARARLNELTYQQRAGELVRIDAALAVVGQRTREAAHLLEETSQAVSDDLVTECRITPELAPRVREVLDDRMADAIERLRRIVDDVKALPERKRRARA